MTSLGAWEYLDGDQDISKVSSLNDRYEPIKR